MISRTTVLYAYVNYEILGKKISKLSKQINVVKWRRPPSKLKQKFKQGYIFIR